MEMAPRGRAHTDVTSVNNKRPNGSVPSPSRRRTGWQKRVCGLLALVAGWASCGAAITNGAAAADLPLYPIQFSGNSAQGHYQVLVETGCYSQGGGSGCGGAPTPRYLYVTLTTSAHAGGTCPGNEVFQFTSGSITAAGTFNVQQAYSNGLTLTVSGSFPSTRSVRGLISATHGCPTDSFSFSLAKPLVKVPPPGHNACYWLKESGASKLLGSFAPINDNPDTGIDPVTGLGRCDYYVHSSAYVGFLIVQQNPDVSGKTVPGLGHRSAVFARMYPASSEEKASMDVTVCFPLRSAWVEILYEVYQKGTPAKLARVEAKTIDAAKLVDHVVA